MTKLFLGLAAIPIFLLLVLNVFAGGPRLDSPEDSTYEGGVCWVNGYDSGFAGKYDKDRAEECQDEKGDEYNSSWYWGCKDSTRTEAECNELINNPVEIEDYEILKTENDRTCYDAGIEDGEADKPYNKDRASGCYEFTGISDGYRGGYQSGCETRTTESTCELRYEYKNNYCPDHPDTVGCVNFLHNTTNKEPSQESLSTSCASVNITCAYEINPEKYCLGYDDPFCKTIGDICDNEGFVRPEYPYCTTN